MRPARATPGDTARSRWGLRWGEGGSWLEVLAGRSSWSWQQSCTLSSNGRRACLGCRACPEPSLFLPPAATSLLQITYHYTRDRSILLKALLRRNLGLGPGTPPQLNASGLLDPALVSYHGATMLAHKKCAAAEAAAVAAVAAAAAEREPSEASAVTAAS